MDDTPRPRRTRQSRQSSGRVSSSFVNTPVINPYKKPTYLAGRDKKPEVQTQVTPSPRGRGRRGRPPGHRGGGSRGHRSARPECVATRTDNSRKSASSSRGKKKRRGGYNTHDYHYGSDFDSDQNESEPEQPVSDLESNSADDNNTIEDSVDSDSDISVESSRLIRLPSPPVPIWLDEDSNSIEELEIPQSSDDLLLPRNLVVKALSIYETIRRFHQLVRLTPFRFEDFCAALSSDEQSSLLAEIHIQLLKAILREEDANGTVFGPNDCKDSVQATLFFMDNMTWAESLRAYIESDPSWTEVLKEITSVEYPFCGPDVRIKILGWLIEIFLATNLVRESLVAEGNILHEDHCRSCNRLGELVCCETCPAVYHLGCIEPPLSEDDPPDDWKCPICVKNKVVGVTECVSDMEKAGLLIRHEHLGYDRHGRKYWFLARRVIVESDGGDEVWYYSTPFQVEELLHQIDPIVYEIALCEAILGQKEEIVRQMQLTEKVTNLMNTQHRKTYLEAENALLKKVHEERLTAKQQEEQDRARQEEEVLKAKRLEEEEKQRQEDELRRKEEEEKKRIREDRLNRRNRNKFGGYAFEDFEPLTPSSIHENSENMDLDDDDVKDEIDEEFKDDDDSSKLDSSSELPQSQFEDTPSPLEPETTTVTTTTTASDSKVEADSQEQTPPDVNETSQTVKDNNGDAVVVDPNTVVDCPNDNSTSNVIKSEVTVPESKVDPNNITAVKEEVVSTTTRSKSVSSTPKLAEESPSFASIRKSKSLLLDVDSEERMTRLKSAGFYKLGHEGTFRSYVNLYTTDPLALSKSQNNEERDRRRHMSHKFSLTTASECKWVGGQQGVRSSIVTTLRATLNGMENSLPVTLMHVNWPILRKAWVSAVANSTTSKDFTRAMIALAACLRPSVFNPVWAEGGGHVKLIRMSAAEREERKKIEKRDKKDRDEEEDRLRLLPQFVKYSIPPKHQAWKQKGEEYRIHGRWGWLWLSTSRPAKPKDFRKCGLLGGPYKHVIQVKNEIGKIKTMLIDPNVYDKLMAKRSLSATTKKPEPSSSNSSSSSQLPTSTTTTGGGVSNNNCQNSPNTNNNLAKGETFSASEADNTVKSMEVEESSVNDQRSEEKTSTTNNSPLLNSPIPLPTSSQSEDSQSEIHDKDEVTDVKLETTTSTESTLKEGQPEDKSNDVQVSDTEIKVENDESANDNNNSSSNSQNVVSGGDHEAETQKIDSSDFDSSKLSQDSTIIDDESIHIEDVKKEEDMKPNVIDSSSVVLEGGKDDDKHGEEKSSEETKEDLPSMGKKVRSEVINVSLGIQSQNRIMYPKLAHRVYVLDNLLARRVKLQALEEKELNTTYGADTIEKIKNQHETSMSSQIDQEMAKLEKTFPCSGTYELKCYSYECQVDKSKGKISPTDQCKCYSPMCRLKFVIQDSQRKKVEKNLTLEKDKLEKLKKEIDEKRMYTKGRSQEKVYLKKLPEQIKRKRTPVKYPVTSGFRTVVSKKPSILIIPQYEIKKLARTAGRSITPIEFAANPKPGNTWAWPYPCGRPYFKTCWQYRTVHSGSLAAAAIQLRILYASVRWDDIQMKPPNLDGKNQVTTDMEIITTEILGQRILGRFAERVQFLRRKQTVPIDAPKTIREVTPSRSGLRKRKRAESPDKNEPVVVEEWVDEDKVDIWEIRLYGDKQDKKGEKKIENVPLTRTKTGVALSRPDKWDPSPANGGNGIATTTTISAVKAADMMKEQYELKMQRAVHLSKRDNHVKANIGTNGKSQMPTASQQLQQQNAAAGLPANPRSYGGPGSSASNISIGGKRLILTKGTIGTKVGAEGQSPVILNRKVGVTKTPTGIVSQGSKTEVIAKIFATPQGSKLVFQGNAQEMTPQVLAQIQAQISSMPGVGPGSVLKFVIQSQTTPTQNSTPKVPISSTPTASSMVTPKTSGVAVGQQQLYKTPDGKIQAIQPQGGQHVLINQNTMGRVGGQIVFKKVVKTAQGTEEVITTRATVPVGSQIVTTSDSSGNATPKQPLFILQPGQELTPQLLQHIQTQLQGMQGLPPGPFQIQTSGPVMNTTNVSTNQFVPVASTATTTGTVIQSPAKFKVNIMPGGQQQIIKTTDGKIVTTGQVLSTNQPKPIVATTTTSTPVKTPIVPKTVSEGLSNKDELTNDNTLSSDAITTSQPTHSPAVSKISTKKEDVSSPVKSMAPMAVKPGVQGGKTTEVFAKVYPSPQGSKLVFQGNVQEITPQVLAQIQAQITSMPTGPPGSLLKFLIQQSPPTTVQNSTPSTPKVPISSTPTASSMVTPKTTGLAVAQQQLYKTPDVKIQPAQQQQQPAQPIATNQNIVGRIPSSGSVIKTTQGTEEVSAAQTPTRVTVPVASQIVTTSDSSGTATPKQPLFILPPGQELTPQLLQQIQTQLQGMQGLPPGPFQIQTSGAVMNTANVSTNQFVPVASTATTTGTVIQSPTKFKVNILPAQQQQQILKTEEKILTTSKVLSTSPAKPPVTTITTSPLKTSIQGKSVSEGLGASPVKPPVATTTTLSSPVKTPVKTPILGKSVSEALSIKDELTNDTNLNADASTTSQPTPSSAVSKASKKKTSKIDSPSPVKTPGQMTQPKLISTLFRHKELLKKDIFKKRGLLEKELHIDIQKEIHEEVIKISNKSPATTSADQPKGSQKRKAIESKTLGKSTPAGANASPTKKRKKNKLYCICQTPYDNSKFYVGCDVCSNWFHGDCIGITEEMSTCLSEYVCDSCQNDASKVYCLCRQPYDESQFYICCDTCQDWFHGRCVGVLQAESNQIDEYVCPNCDSTTPLNHANLKPLSYEDYPLLSKLLKQIQGHKCAWPFLEPVDPTEART